MRVILESGDGLRKEHELVAHVKTVRRYVRHTCNDVNCDKPDFMTRDYEFRGHRDGIDGLMIFEEVI